MVAEHDGPFTSPAIFIKSFLNSIQLRQKSGILGSPLNCSLKVLPDEEYKTKLVNFEQKNVESCKPNPCQNEGKCTNKKSKKFCQCIGHFTGKIFIFYYCNICDNFNAKNRRQSLITCLLEILIQRSFNAHK